VLAAEGHGDARIEHVAQLAEFDAQLVTAQLRGQRHRGRWRHAFFLSLPPSRLN
jgi:hypothetical protein